MNQDSPDELELDLSGERFREIGYQVVDFMAEILDAECADPVLRPADGETVCAAVDEGVPRRGRPVAEVLAACRENILPYGRKNGHPRFFGYVSASADPIGALADAVASVLNQNVTSWRSAPSATEIEHLVVRWLDEMVGFGGSSGILTSGGSVANANALACAVARAEDEAGGDRRRMTLYVSREGHMSLAKAARHLGLPDEHVRQVAIDAERRLDVGDLAARLAADRAAGLVPAAVCASAGTANTGAIDPLTEVADLCRPLGGIEGGAHSNGSWFHVDGAYGALAAVTESYGFLRDAFARADSLSLDPHKWLFAPLDAGCVLIRDATAARGLFAKTSEYVAVAQTAPIERHAFWDYGPELSRRFRAFKVWMILKVRGLDTIAAAIERNIALTREFDRRVAGDERLEPLGSELSICCFRFVGAGKHGPEELNELNRCILEEMVRDGHVFMSPTTLEGRYSLRVALVNFRTSSADIDFLVKEVLRIGERMTPS